MIFKILKTGLSKCHIYPNEKTNSASLLMNLPRRSLQDIGRLGVSGRGAGRGSGGEYDIGLLGEQCGGVVRLASSRSLASCRSR